MTDSRARSSAMGRDREKARSGSGAKEVVVWGMFGSICRLDSMQPPLPPRSGVAVALSGRGLNRSGFAVQEPLPA